MPTITRRNPSGSKKNTKRKKVPADPLTEAPVQSQTS
jgi:hypothetical protein